MSCPVFTGQIYLSHIDVCEVLSSRHKHFLFRYTLKSEHPVFTRGLPLLSDLLVVTRNSSRHSETCLHNKYFLRQDRKEEKERATATEIVKLCIVRGAAVYAITPSSGLCCCFFAALQRPVLPLAHNFRLVSLATRVSAHGEQLTSLDESLCQYSHDH